MLKNNSENAKKPRIVWHPQDVQVLVEIVTNMKTAKGTPMTDILVRGRAKNIQIRKEYIK